MESITPATAANKSGLLKKICLHRIDSVETLWMRLRGKYKKNWQEFKLMLQESPCLAWTLRITVPLIAMLVWMGVIVAYNTYSRYQTDCQMYRAQVGVEIKRREDLIPNLVLCVTRYESHEKDIMKHVSDARAALSGPATIDAKIAASQAMQGALGKLLAIVEQYPNLKASEPVQSLIKELSTTENRIADGKGKYNESARAFNNFYTTFPTNILALCFGINKPIPYINTDEDLIRTYAIELGREEKP